MNSPLLRTFVGLARKTLSRHRHGTVLPGLGLMLTLSLRAATVTVDTTTDVLDGTTTSIASLNSNKGADAKISLREAIIAANNTAGADTVLFSAAINGTPITLSRVGNDATCVNGDLDINGSLALVGNGTNNTIIQGASAYNSTTKTYTGSIGDKVIGINQDGFYTNLTVTISDLMIRWAQNTNAFGSPDFSHTGGGVDVYMTGMSNSIVFTNCVITENANANAYGAGVNVDAYTSFLPGDVESTNRGSVTFTRCTISNNRANPNQTGNDGSGGGLCLFGDIHDVTITDCVIAGNTTATNANKIANGGGILILHTHGGTVKMTGGFVTNNSSMGTGGGIAILGEQNINMSGVTIANNTSVTANLGSANGGGLTIYRSLGGTMTPTITVSNCTVTGNSALNGPEARGGGVYFGGLFGATLSGCTISGNTSSVGGGVANVGNTVGVSLTVDNCTITNNNATSGAGLANVTNTFVSSLPVTSLTRSIISGNTASSAGGGLYVNGGTFTAAYNRILNNNASTGKNLAQAISGTANVTNNWWGTNSPSSLISGTVNFTPWLMLTHSANPSTIFLPNSTTLTATFLTNSAGTAIASTNLSRLIGLPVTFNNAVRGTLSGAQTAIQSSGSATATFTANAVGAGSADAVVDNQTTTGPVTIATGIASINRVQTTPTNLNSIQWTVTFSNAVSGVTSGNFSLVNTGLGGSPSITSVTAVGGAPATSWTVTAGTGSGTGTLGLNMVNGTSVSASIANLPFTGQVYAIDLVSPSITISSPSVPLVNIGGAVTYTVTYADVNFNSSTLATNQITLNKTGSANATPGVSGTGTTRTVTLTNITGQGTVGISIAAGTATDTAGNGAPSAGPSSTFRIAGIDTTLLSVTTAPSNSVTKVGNTYSWTVATTDGSTLVNASTTDTNASVKFDSGIYAQSSQSASFTLGFGVNSHTATVRAEDGVTTTVYQLQITRPLSTNANLSSLTLSAGTLSPVFNPSINSYSATVGDSISNVVVTGIAADTNASVQMNGGPYLTGTNSTNVSLLFGTNSVSVVVQAQDGVQQKTNLISIIRTPGVPSAVSIAGTNVTSDSATFRGLVNPRGAETTVWFAWGTSTNLGNITASQVVASGDTNSGIDLLVTSLLAGTTNYYQLVATNSAGSAMGSLVWFVTPLPILNSLSPTSGPTTGGTTLTLQGTNFGLNPTVTLGGRTCSIGIHGETQIECWLPAGQGSDQAVVVSVGGTNTASRLFSYYSPVVDSVAPPNGPNAGGIEITLNGSNFGTNGTVTLDAAPCVINSYTNTRIKFVLPAGAGTGKQIVVTVSGQNSLPKLFDYYGPPIITSISTPTNGSFSLQFSGGAGVNYTLQSSTNLTAWDPLTNLTAGTDGAFNFTDSSATNYPRRFYRLSTP